MKTQFGIAGLLISALITSSAFADSLIQKPVTRIDFNKMIDENDNSKMDLEKSVNTQMADIPVTNNDRVTDDKSSVMDFVDVEIGLGEDRPVVDRPVVDRRYNSVGEPRIATEFNVQMVANKTDKGS